MADEKTPGDEAQTFEQKVNSIVDQFQVGEDGKALKIIYKFIKYYRVPASWLSLPFLPRAVSPLMRS